jgi:hypothetical protein
VFALVGSGVHIAPMLKLALAIALFLVSMAFGVYLYRRQRGVALDESLDEALGENAEQG